MAVYAFIGGGSMGYAMLEALSSSQVIPERYVADPHESSRERARNLGAEVYASATLFPQTPHVVILAVKPQSIPEVLAKPLPWISKEKHVWVSIAAGVSVASLRRYLPDSVSIVRAMPNTPAQIQQGFSALFSRHSLNVEQKHLVEDLFAALGRYLWIDDENLMHAVTAISGSGPAYVFYMIETMLEVAQELGLSEEQARASVFQTVLGATRLSEHQDPARLRALVTSKGGTTEAALDVLEKDDWKNILKKAIRSAHQQSQNLGKT